MTLYVLLAAASLTALPAAPATGPSADIIVQGDRDRERHISDFIKTLTPAPVRGQTARFESAVCPAVVGLSDAQNAFIAGRIRRIAETAAIPVGGADCKPNAILAVTNDKRALLKHLAKKAPYFFPESWSVFKVHELERDTNPFAPWHIERRRGADDKLLSQASVAGAGVRDQPRDFYVQKIYGSTSRLMPPARTDFVASMVIVQADALAGLTTTQLADYAAMRTLVRTDPAQLRGATTDTILGAIDAPMGTPVPLTLTAWDLGFLKAFYASDKNSYVEYQRSQMQRLMRQNLDSRPARSQ